MAKAQIKDSLNEELIAKLLNSLSEEEIQTLLNAKKSKEDEKKPRLSVSGRVIDNKNFEVIRDQCRSDIAFDNLVDRRVSERRDPIKKISINCLKCKNLFNVFPSQIVDIDENGNKGYRCTNCSKRG